MGGRRVQWLVELRLCGDAGGGWCVLHLHHAACTDPIKHLGNAIGLCLNSQLNWLVTTCWCEPISQHRGHWGEWELLGAASTPWG